MPIPERIVCAVDFSEHAKLALAIAKRWCQSFGCPLLLVHTFDPAPVGPSAALPYPAWPTAAASRAIERDARAHLTALGVEHLQGVQHEIDVVGHPNAALGICDRARPTDLIVMGTHGRTGLRRVLMGSVAEQTLRHAPCPVLVVRGDVDAETFPRELLVCTDFSTEAHPAIALGQAVARSFSARASLLHARSEHAWRRDVDVNEAAGEPDVEAAARAALETIHREHFSPPVNAAFVVAKSVPDAIVRHAERTNTDLIVLATHGRTGLSRLAIGSVAEHVTRHAGCAVLVARTPKA